MKEIWYESNELNKIKTVKNEDLNVCQSCKYVENCNRCPAVAHMETKTFDSCDLFAKKLAQIRTSNYAVGN